VCTHKIAIGESSRINVRFGAVSGHKPDIVSCPLSAIKAHSCDAANYHSQPPLP
jgi:hypothetical protein